MSTIDVNEARRIAWVSEQLSRLPKGALLLDAGAGEQQYRQFCGHLNYTSQDFAAYNPEQLKKGLQMGKWDYGQLDIVSDIVSIPRPDASFDAILCTEVFEHIPDPLAALREFTRLLKPGGTLILTAPFCSMTHFAPYHFSSGFNRYFYEHHLPLLGFSVRELTPSGNYFDYVAQEAGRAPHVAATYGGKSYSRFENWILNKAKQILLRSAAENNASAELLNFGWHVVAVKN